MDISQAKIEDLSRDQCLAMLQAYWSHLLLHDEVVLAARVLECAPWKVRGGPEVARMAELTAAMLEHTRDPAVYRRMYGDYASGLNHVESIPIPNEVLHEYSQWPRFDLFDRSLKEAEAAGRRLTYLDVGSHDGWLTNRAGLRGHLAWGIDACSAYVDLANRRAREHNTGALHERSFFMVDPHPPSFPRSYDLVSCFEVYEHVPETLPLIQGLAKMLSPGGRLILTTPHGSWLRGQQVDYHEQWNEPKPREHVRAPTPEDVRADLEKAGFRVDEITTSEGKWASPNVPGQTTLLVTASLP